MKKINLLATACLLLALCSCREDIYIDEEEVENVTYPSAGSAVKGFFLLNEGNMNMNKASIDYFSYETGEYHRNIYPSRNPSEVKELGDVGNDLQIYKERLYAVINASNYVEVMDLLGRHIKGIEVPNGRYIVFNDDKAYVSSYATMTSSDPDGGKGLVFEIDLNTLAVSRKTEVGYQPEQMVVFDRKLYVANSGGYRAPHYDRTVSVVDLDNFKETKTIDVAVNLHLMQANARGEIYVTSRGDYYTVNPNLYVIDAHTDEVVRQLDIPASGMCLSGDSLYYYSSLYDYNTGSSHNTYGILNTETKEVVSENIITDGTEKQIITPYELKINPDTKEIFITDVQDYLVNGLLYCFSPEGKFRWKVLTGSVPAHIAFSLAED